MNVHVPSRHWKDLDTPGKIDAIKSVYEPRMSAREIGEKIPGASRNSIIGIYHRHADKLVDFPLPSTGGGVTRNGTKSAIIIAYIHANPEATAPEIAARTGTNHAYVHKVVKANGLTIPRGEVGGRCERLARGYEYEAPKFVRVPKPERPAWIDAPIPAGAPPPRMVSPLKLEPNECKWPYGDPKEADFGFCAHERAPGSPYCRYHAARSSGSFHCEEQAA